MRKLGVFGLMLFVSVIPVCDAGGIPIGIPAQEITQLQNYFQLAKQVITEANMLQAQFSQLQWMIYNSQQIGTHPMTTIENDLANLSHVVTQAGGLSYGMGQIDRQFATMFPAYTPQQDWLSAYTNWSNSLMKTVQGTVSSVGLQGSQMASEQSVLRKIRTMTQTPMGQAQAIELGNTISSETVNQLAKLRQLMMSDIDSKQAWMAYQVQKDATQQQAIQNGFSGTVWQADQRRW